MVPARRRTQCGSDAGLEITSRDRYSSLTPHAHVAGGDHHIRRMSCGAINLLSHHLDGHAEIPEPFK